MDFKKCHKCNEFIIGNEQHKCTNLYCVKCNKKYIITHECDLDELTCYKCNKIYLRNEQHNKCDINDLIYNQFEKLNQRINLLEKKIDDFEIQNVEDTNDIHYTNMFV